MLQVQEKSNGSNVRFYEELGQVFFYHFPKYHMKILLEVFKANVGRENIFKPTIGNESLHQDSKDNCVRIVHIPASKTLSLRARCSPTGTITSKPGPLRMGRTTNRSITY
jgi:hypothetical protein